MIGGDNIPKSERKMNIDKHRVTTILIWETKFRNRNIILFWYVSLRSEISYYLCTDRWNFPYCIKANLFKEFLWIIRIYDLIIHVKIAQKQGYCFFNRLIILSFFLGRGRGWIPGVLFTHGVCGCFYTKVGQEWLQHVSTSVRG